MHVLVIGNSVLSEEESNGRILRSLLGGFDNSELTSFGLRGIPNCSGVQYCTVTDKDALMSFLSLGLRRPRGIQVGSFNPAQRNKNSNSAFGHVLRDVVWFSELWRDRRFRRWEKGLAVSAVFLMAADAPFLYHYARRIAKKKHVPLVVYSSEDYPLKRYDYMSKKKTMSILCRLFLRRLRKEARRAFEFAGYSLFGCEELDSLFSTAFRLKRHKVIYQPGSIRFIGATHDEKIAKRVIYGGNINKERLSSLIDIATTAKEIIPSLQFTLFGAIKDDWSKTALEEHAELFDYCGSIKYERLLEEYSRADLLIHAEGFDEFNKLDYAHSFSTKIGDCYMSGVPFFQYGPAELPCIAFGQKACPDYVASNKDELKDKLGLILTRKSNYQPNVELLVDSFDATHVGLTIRNIVTNAYH